MTMRNFIEIDESRCTGCGNCVTACAEGALEIINGKAVVINDIFCDGLGACIGHCPEDALKIIQKDVPDFDEAAVKNHLKSREKSSPSLHVPHTGCPGSQMRERKRAGEVTNSASESPALDVPSELAQWPIQLHLVNPGAPYFKGANLLIAASCSAFSFGNFHRDFIKNHALMIACPKLDRTEPYVAKLADIIRTANPASITVVIMEVPCCRGLSAMVQQAIQESGKRVPYLESIITLDGEIQG